jgi:hypothetical protein
MPLRVPSRQRQRVHRALIALNIQMFNVVSFWREFGMSLVFFRPGSRLANGIIVIGSYGTHSLD